MGLVTAKLEETAAHVVALSILLLNLRKIQCAFLQFLDWLLGLLQSREKRMVIQWTLDRVGNKSQPSGGLCREVQADTRLQENHSTVYINPELVYTTEPQYARGKAIAVSALAFMSNSAPAYTLLAFCEKPESLDNHKLGAQSLKF